MTDKQLREQFERDLQEIIKGNPFDWRVSVEDGIPAGTFAACLSGNGWNAYQLVTTNLTEDADRRELCKHVLRQLSSTLVWNVLGVR